jgi:RNA polymerase sigma-70 factor (ECF subfamily)
MNQAPLPDLIQEAQAGDEAAFEELLAPLMEPAYRLACGMLHDPQAAEDAVQEAALSAWRKLSRLRGMDMRPWFLRIVANQCRSVRRGRWWSVLKVAEANHTLPSPEDRVVLRADLLRALRRLSYPQRLVVVLYFFLDLSFEEIAAVSGASAGAVKQRLYRAVRQLKPHIEVPEVHTR